MKTEQYVIDVSYDPQGSGANDTMTMQKTVPHEQAAKTFAICRELWVLLRLYDQAVAEPQVEEE